MTKETKRYLKVLSALGDIRTFSAYKAERILLLVLRYYMGNPNKSHELEEVCRVAKLCRHKIFTELEMDAHLENMRLQRIPKRA